jgi:hypothetical protein
MRSSAPRARAPLEAAAGAAPRRPRRPPRARRPYTAHALQRVRLSLRGPDPGVAEALPAGAGTR